MKRRKVITLILLGVFLLGLSVLLYPSVSSYWNSVTQSRAVVDYDMIVKSLSPKDYTALYEIIRECRKIQRSPENAEFPAVGVWADRGL